MGKKVARRLLISIFSLWVISLLSFGLMELTPGGPMALYAENPKITYADRMRIAQQLGLDKPAHVRYVIWVKNVVRGDLGTSYATGRPVAKEILVRLPATLKLMTVSFILSVMIAIPIGIYSATHRYSVFDNIVTTGSFFGLSLPVFWFGILSPPPKLKTVFIFMILFNAFMTASSVTRMWPISSNILSQVSLVKHLPLRRS
jgi:peptide/nickel transport system permease protein